MANATFQKISVADWEKIPTAKPAPKKNQWDDALEQIVDGDIVGIPVQDEKDLRGIRIGLARRASAAYDVKLAFKFDASRKILAVRLSGEKPETHDENSEPKRRGRPKTR